MEQMAYEAGVPSFPNDLSKPIARLFVPQPEMPSTWDGFGVAAAVQLAVEAHRRDLAEAWAWRVADTMPDGEQSRRDALADAAQMREVPRASRGPAYRHRDSMRNVGVYGALTLSCLRPPGDADEAAHYATLTARAAFRACPGLRGES